MADPSRPVGTRAWAAGGCLALGLAEWSWFVVGRSQDDRVTELFLPAILVTTVLAGVLFDGRPRNIALATFAGPFATAGWTAPRGDNDGLWGLIFVELAVFALFATLLIAVLRMLRSTARWRHTTHAFLVSHHAMAVAAIAVAAVVSVALLFARRPDPFPGLERAAATFPAPASFTRTGSQRSGDPLCQSSCIATVEVTYESKQSSEAACATVAESLARWHETVVRPSDPSVASGFCSWDVTHVHTGGYVDVSGEPGGSVVTLTLYDPRNRRAVYFQL